MFNLKLLFTFAFCCFSLASSNPVKQSKYHSCQQFNTPRPLISIKYKFDYKFDLIKIK